MSEKDEGIARMLEELRLKNIEHSRRTLTECVTAQIDEILQSSMSRRDKRSALYRVRRNSETTAQHSCDGYNRQFALFGVSTTLTTADLLPDIDFSSLLANSVTVQESPKLEPSSNLSPPSLSPSLPLPTPSVDHLVPIALQPLEPIIEMCYPEVAVTRREKLFLDFRTYHQITVQQTLAYIKHFGQGVDDVNDFSGLSVHNHRLVVAYIMSLRPCLANGNRFIGVLVHSDHPAYSFWNGNGGLLRSLRVWSCDAAEVRDSRIRFNDIINEVSKGERGHLIQEIPYAEDCSGLSSGGSSMLVHLLMWFRRFVGRSDQPIPGEGSLQYHGYFYDPEFRTSYLTLSTQQIVEKLKEISITIANTRTDKRSSTATFIPP